MNLDELQINRKGQMSKLMLILASMKLWKVKFTLGILKLTFKTSSSLDSSKTESYNQAQK